jgi:hypothetical protein
MPFGHAIPLPLDNAIPAQLSWYGHSASVSQQWPYKLANRNVHRPCLQQLDAGHVAFTLLHQQD